MPEELAPPVVAVVVASDSGPWLEQTLTSLAAQDYDNLTTIVVDAASERPLARRVARITPTFYFARLEENRGYGPSANAVLGLAEGAAYYLFCHDDVVLEVEAVRRLVEEAFRSNAGIVGPKLVDPDEPDRILQLGLDMDRFGAPVRRVERREFDQAQHDEAREVFAVPGGCLLVRADLFEAIGGFDDQISMFGEDVDLAWRARIAGARVTITPLATVSHLEATAARRRPMPEARALQWRHELRAVLKNYSAPRRFGVVAQLVVLSAAEVVYFVAIGRSRRAREVIDAWRWNFARDRELKFARADVASSRRLPDRIVLRLASRSSFRFLRAARAAAEDAVVRRSIRHDMKRHPAGREFATLRPRSVTVGAVVAGAVILIGSRLLLVGHLPLVGTYLPIPSPGRLLADYFGGSSGAGNGPVGPVSPAYAFFGIAGAVFGGAMGFVLKLAMVFAVLAGAFGVVRLVRPLGSSIARLAAAVAYLFLPLLADDFGRAALPALAVYAVMPFIVKRLCEASGLSPYGSGDTRIWSFAVARDTLVLGVLVAVAGAFAPSAVLATGACAVGLALVCALSGSFAAAARAVTVTALAIVLSFVLCFPWSLTFLQPGASSSVFFGVQRSGSGVADLAALSRFDLGPIGHSPLAYGLLAASAFVLFVGGAERFAWAARLWGAGVVSLGVAWAAGEGYLAAGGGDGRVLATPVAVCVAGAVGLGVASLSGGEVAKARFGWRHAASAAFVIVGVLGVLPVLGEAAGGRWELPQNGYDAVLSGIAGSKGGLSSGRVLWLGAPDAVPGNGWQLRPGFEEMLASSLLPNATADYPSANPGTARLIGGEVADAELGRTVELGLLLSRQQVAAIVVPSAFAPQLASAAAATPEPPPADLLAALQSQSDLRALPTEGGTLVFENTAWTSRPVVRSGRALALPVPKGSTPAFLRSLGVAAAVLAWFACAAVGWAWRRRAARDRRRRRVPAVPHSEPEAAPVLVKEAVG
jgi:GT2 family glycosyltransferase